MPTDLRCPRTDHEEALADALDRATADLVTEAYDAQAWTRTPEDSWAARFTELIGDVESVRRLAVEANNALRLARAALRLRLLEDPARALAVAQAWLTMNQEMNAPDGGDEAAHHACA